MKGETDSQQTEVAVQRDKKLWLIPLLVVPYVVLGLVTILVLWIAIASVDKRNPDRALPQNCMLYMSTGSFYTVAKPVIESDYIDSVLQECNMVQAEDFVTQIRKSSLYKNCIVKSALSRPVSFCMNQDGSIVAAVDMGWTSAVSRLLPLFEKMRFLKNSASVSFADGVFVIATPKSNVYVAVKHNLVIAASSLNGIHDALSLSGSVKKQLWIAGAEVNVIADMNKLSSNKMITDVAESYGIDMENPLFKSVSGIFNFTILPDVMVKLGVTQVGQKRSLLSEKFAKKATMCISLQVEDVKELKDQVLSLVSSDKSVTETMAQVNEWCQDNCDKPLDEVLADAKIKECAFVQTTAGAEPVFVIRAENAKKYAAIARKAVSENFTFKDGCVYLSKDPEKIKELLAK